MIQYDMYIWYWFVQQVRCKIGLGRECEENIRLILASKKAHKYTLSTWCYDYSKLNPCHCPLSKTLSSVRKPSEEDTGLTVVHFQTLARLDRAVAQFPPLPAVCKGAQVTRNNGKMAATSSKFDRFSCDVGSRLFFFYLDSDEIYWNTMESSQDMSEKLQLPKVAEDESLWSSQIGQLEMFPPGIFTDGENGVMASDEKIEADARHAQCLCGRVFDESE